MNFENKPKYFLLTKTLKQGEMIAYIKAQDVPPKIIDGLLECFKIAKQEGLDFLQRAASHKPRVYRHSFKAYYHPLDDSVSIIAWGYNRPLGAARVSLKTGDIISKNKPIYQ